MIEPEAAYPAAFRTSDNELNMIEYYSHKAEEMRCQKLT